MLTAWQACATPRWGAGPLVALWRGALGRCARPPPSGPAGNGWGRCARPPGWLCGWGPQRPFQAANQLLQALAFNAPSRLPISCSRLWPSTRSSRLPTCCSGLIKGHKTCATPRPHGHYAAHSRRSPCLCCSAPCRTSLGSLRPRASRPGWGRSCGRR